MNESCSKGVCCILWAYVVIISKFLKRQGKLIVHTRKSIFSPSGIQQYMKILLDTITDDFKELVQGRIYLFDSRPNGERFNWPSTIFMVLVFVFL